MKKAAISDDRRAEQERWEQGLRDVHPHVAFYIEVRNGVQYVVAYDSKDASKGYGEFKP